MHRLSKVRITVLLDVLTNSDSPVADKLLMDESLVKRDIPCTCNTY